MKKLFNISAALAIMLMARGLASCSSNAEPEPAPEKTVEVTFKAQLPSRIDARAIADGTKANELFFYVYDVHDGPAQHRQSHAHGQGDRHRDAQGVLGYFTRLSLVFKRELGRYRGNY